MALEKLLEINLNQTFDGTRVKAMIVGHCSCGRDYVIKEKFDICA